MADKQFKKADDLASFAEDLRQFYQPRDRRLMSLQAMWQMSLRETNTKRTVYKSNEPWKATRLTTSLLAAGKPTWRVSLPDEDGMDKVLKDEATSATIKLMQAVFFENDQRRIERGLSTFDRGWAYLAAIYGWTAGIALVQDGTAKGEFPVFVDLWNPFDTYAEWNKNEPGVVHYSRMSYGDIVGTFGPKRKGGKIKGYEFTFSEEDEPDWDDQFTVVEFFGKETHGALVKDTGGEGKWLKPQMEHHLGCNPAWHLALDAPPIQHTVTSEKDGSVLKSGRPDTTNSRWLETYGQSPMLGYETAYRVKTERMNQVGDVMERWANPKMIAKTPDGKLVKIDLSNPDSIGNVPLGTQFEILTPSTFPIDTRAYLDVLDEDLETASYSKAAYGALTSSDAATALQMARQGGNYIVGPMVNQLQAIRAMVGNKVLKQLEMKSRKKTFAAPIAARVPDKKGEVTWTSLRVDRIPDGTRVSCTLRGAGMQPDKLQAAAIASNLANAQNPIYDMETLHDEILQSDNPPDVVAKLFWSRMTSSRKVDEYAAPITTLLFWADKLEAQGTKRGIDLANSYRAMAEAAMVELQSTLITTEVKAKQSVEQAMNPMAALTSGAAPGQDAALASQSQVEGAAPLGAPAAGVQAAPTGPAPERGAQMAAAAQQAPV